MSTPDLATLRDALTAARPALTGEQQDAADALLVALTPRMDEPTWPGAVVMAACVEPCLRRSAGVSGRGSFRVILRRAANLLRERATGATPGPWDGYARLPVVLAPREEWDLGGGLQRIAYMAMPYREERMRANAAYITLMHPPVALALADWLDDEAARGLGRPDNVAAYAVARAVLREAGE